MNRVILSENDVCNNCGEIIAAGEAAYEDERDETTVICESCYDEEPDYDSQLKDMD